MKHQITTDGKTVWINSPEVCLGRFSPQGIDVHRTAEQQIESGISCLACTPEPDWDSFVASMKESHDITVEVNYRPLWSWDPGRWARAMILAHGRRALRKELERLASAGLNPWGDKIHYAWGALRVT